MLERRSYLQVAPPRQPVLNRRLTWISPAPIAPVLWRLTRMSPNPLKLARTSRLPRPDRRMKLWIPRPHCRQTKNPFRRQLLVTLQASFSTSAASGTVRTYESALRAIAPRIALRLGAQVSPTHSACQFYSFFGSVVLLGPKSRSKVSGQQGV